MDGLPLELPIFLFATFAGAFVAGLSGFCIRADRSVEELGAPAAQFTVGAHLIRCCER